MKTVCKWGSCTACNACASICSKGAISLKEDIDSINAIIDEKKCVHCGLCENVCQVNHPIELVKPFEWYQGWTNVDGIRKISSSGGYATTIAKSFIERGGYVASCCYKTGKFEFDIVSNTEDVFKFSKSKYVKSNTGDVYIRIRDLLKNGEKVLFIGLPCQVAGLKKIIPEKYQNLLYTIDLICHGTPTQRLFRTFLNQNNINLNLVKNISFRENGFYTLKIDGKCIEAPNVCDSYTIGFLEGLTYSRNCYKCRYATIDRVADLTLGDSWGSKYSAEEKKGISLALCQNQKGKSLLLISNVKTMKVNIENAIIHNKQLSAPAQMPTAYDTIMEKLSGDKSLNILMLRYATSKSIKQKIKKLLFKES